ncbi:hypothetical protein EYF80_026879 [Liparis tanakae]|uniref:Uncharacterized protein n=1 Tax=Liparis tanakae TaxID=230148 RepID=A0A4Z2HAJ9_9TELE|nr:hypothetical protein EYF80_026879 [Liparis tanakae]
MTPVLTLAVPSIPTFPGILAASTERQFTQEAITSTGGRDNVEQHLHLAGEERPGAVGVLPADHVALLASDHHLAQHALWHPQVRLPRA